MNDFGSARTTGGNPDRQMWEWAARISTTFATSSCAPTTTCWWIRATTSKLWTAQAAGRESRTWRGWRSRSVRTVDPLRSGAVGSAKSSVPSRYLISRRQRPACARAGSGHGRPRAFGLRVAALNRNGRTDCPASMKSVPHGSWAIHSRGAVVFTLSSTQQTWGLMDAAAIGRPGCFVTEPLPEPSPLWELTNVLISPHGRMVTLFTERLRRCLAGAELHNADPPTGTADNQRW